MLRFIAGMLMIVTIPDVYAGPREFGLSELRKAFAERSQKELPVQLSLQSGPPEAFEIRGSSLTASDERGLMYSLLSAAEQIRTTGQLHAVKEAPQTSIRGIRKFIHNADLEADWYYSRDYWERFFSMLAKDRFNRFNLVFAHQTDYLAPPYPFWVDIPEFPGIRAKNLTTEQRNRNLEMLQFISRSATEHGIDFTLGVWEHNIQDYRKPPMKPMTDGLTAQNIGPYSYAALKKVLQLCPDISSVQMRTNNESGIPPAQQVDFYRNYVFRAIRDAGRPVILDLRGWIVAGGMVKAAGEIGIPVRLSTKYWAEDLGRPYQPAETYPNYSYLNFLEKPRSYGFYWELWGLGSSRLLLWGNPEYVRRAVSTFSLGGATGFEVDPPLAQAGFGNAPGKWTVFTDGQQQRRFWKWDFERYWLFYRLWGRLSYNAASAEAVWMGEMQRRFGAAARDVMNAYRAASNVIPEIVAVHLADPNMYLWPEINPGGLIDSYIHVLPSDWRYVASFSEAVSDMLGSRSSAKQTPIETAARFDRWASDIDIALDRARAKIAPDNREWSSTEPDLQVLSLMARYHARKQRAALALAFFDATADTAALAEARRELTQGLSIWQKLVGLTDGLYPEQMAFGPDDVGHWKDKLPYVRHDLEIVKRREEVLQKYGRFVAAFDFGGAVKSQPSYGSYRQDNYVLQNNVEPRFRPVDPATRYSAETGFGWMNDGPRKAAPIPLTPYLEVRGAAKNPENLPHDVLLRDSVEGSGAQKFGVQVPDGSYDVRLLFPDGRSESMHLTSAGGRLEVPFPEGTWNISGLVVSGGKDPSFPGWSVPEATGSPMRVTHQAPATAQAGQDLRLQVAANSADHVNKIRLYYRPVNQLSKFSWVEGKAGEPILIPGSAISAKWDLMYYFELFGANGRAQFLPDPHVATPYYVVRTTAAAN